MCVTPAAVPSEVPATLGTVSADRNALLARLEEHYRLHGWPVRREDDGTLRASGPGGVTWIGSALVREDVVAESLDEKLTQLADTRMPVGGELCPVDLLAAEDCEEQVRAALNRLRLDERPHVSLYSSAA